MINYNQLSWEERFQRAQRSTRKTGPCRVRVLATTAEEYRIEVLRRKAESMRKSRLKNIEKVRARERAYRNRPEIRARRYAVNKQWRQRHVFSTTMRSVNSEARYRAVTTKQLAALYKKQRGMCALTHRRLTRDTMTIDHIMPLALGGASTIDNLRWVCRAANEAKGRNTDAQLFQLCAEILAHNARKP